MLEQSYTPHSHNLALHSAGTTKRRLNNIFDQDGHLIEDFLPGMTLSISVNRCDAFDAYLQDCKTTLPISSTAAYQSKNMQDLESLLHVLIS